VAFALSIANTPPERIDEMNSRHGLWVASMPLVAAALAGCGPHHGSDDMADGGAAPDDAMGGGVATGGLEPCSLLSVDEATEVLGSASSEPMPDTPAGDNTCQWTTVDVTIGALVALATSPSLYDTVESTFADDPDFEQLSIGEMSFFVDTGGAKRVDFVRGPNYISLATAVADSEDRLIALATEIANRI